VPISVRERIGSYAAGTIAYLSIRSEPDGRGLQAAIFLVNERAEPLDFCFNRVDLPSATLWRSGEARRHAIRSLVLSLLPACPGTPELLIADASELPPQVFTEDLEVDIPHCRVATEPSLATSILESAEQIGERTHVFWVGGPPAPDAPARQLLEQLAARNLLIEPFERATSGLDEAFRAT
jgi:hypothetical protein